MRVQSKIGTTQNKGIQDMREVEDTIARKEDKKCSECLHVLLHTCTLSAKAQCIQYVQ